MVLPRALKLTLIVKFLSERVRVLGTAVLGSLLSGRRTRISPQVQAELELLGVDRTSMNS